jgi:hypothetical protein
MALNFPSSPTIGQVYTDTTSGFSYEWDGTVWRSYSPSSTSQIKALDDISESFDGIETTFPLTSNSLPVSPLNSQSLIINLGGVVQDSTDDYSVSGSNLIFSTPPTSGLSFSGISLGPAIPVSTIPDGTVTDGSLRISTTAVVGSATTFTEDLVVQGDARITGILTVGTSSIIFDGNNNTISIGGSVVLGGDDGILNASSANIGDSVEINSEGINVSGIITATTFSGDGSRLTGVGVGTDDSINTTGIITATSFSGDGSGLTEVEPKDGSVTTPKIGNSIYTITTTSTDKTLANRERTYVSTSARTITLPESPQAGWEVAISVGNFTNTVVARNNQLIMGLAENMTINRANVAVTLYFVDATNGWRIV